MTTAEKIVGRNIRRIRQAKDLTLDYVEHRAGLGDGNLSRIERGKQWVSEEKLFAIAAALDVEPAQLFMRGDNFEHNPAAAGKLPLVSWVQAGSFCEVIDNFQPGDAEEWITCPFKHGPRAYILRVVGDSMLDPTGERSFREGDFIAVDPDVEPRHKSLVIVRLDQDKTATFKQLLVEPNGNKMLMALNPSWPNRIIEINQDATICGVIIGKWSAEAF